MLRKLINRTARASALARSEIHTQHCDDRAVVGFETRKNALSQIKANRQKIRELAARIGPINRDKAEAIADRYFPRESETWLRSVAKLTGQRTVATLYYYRKTLPDLREAEASNEEASEGGSGIDVAAIIAAELGDDDPD